MLKEQSKELKRKLLEDSVMKTNENENDNDEDVLFTEFVKNTFEDDYNDDEIYERLKREQYFS